MGELLGVGLTHYPPMCGVDGDMAHLLAKTLEDDSIPAEHRSPASWPEEMREEWADDQGAAAAALHRAELVAGFATVRNAIDRFDPDAVVIVGDDQYENFREDLIPPFAVLAYGDVTCSPWAEAQRSSVMGDRPNVWGEPPETEFVVKGRPDIAKLLTSGLLQRDIDVAYAYRQLHHPSLSHAFINAILFGTTPAAATATTKGSAPSTTRPQMRHNPHTQPVRQNGGLPPMRSPRFGRSPMSSLTIPKP